ncbi:WD40 repeat domain-containing protein [Deinococcus sp. KSM4-11]|uniref:WD40 repeat domain-containing protein n=1 Tax=Deinococcus sp. KSM4-11 TaxID=2568654 RepID=UPI001454E059|nr:WD40 repeat domain-containing protein [Deinococcus sp. KSM4-11]
MIITLFDRLGEERKKDRQGFPGERPMEFDRVSPDGSGLAIVEADHHLRIVDARTGHTRWHARIQQDAIVTVIWSPDGQLLCSSGEEGWVTLIRASSGAIIWSHHLGEWTQGLAFSPDSEWIAVGSHSEALLILNAATGVEQWHVDLGLAVYATSWSHDGEFIAAAGEYNLLAVVHARDGLVVWQLPTGRNSDVWASVRWHRTAPLLAALRYSGAELVVFNARTEQQVFQARTEDVQMFDVEWLTGRDALRVSLATGGTVEYQLALDTPPQTADVALPSTARLAAQTVITYNAATELLRITRSDNTLLLTRFGEVIHLRSTRLNPAVVQPEDILATTPGAGDQFVWRERELDSGQLRWYPFSAFWTGQAPD